MPYVFKTVLSEGKPSFVDLQRWIMLRNVKINPIMAVPNETYLSGRIGSMEILIIFKEDKTKMTHVV